MATPPALNVTAPVRVPAAVGAKVTLMEQELPAPREEPQVVVRAKSPLMLMLESVNELDPVLLIVMLCGALVVPTVCAAKVNAVGEMLTDTVGVVPVPLKLAVCGLLRALSFTVSVPLRLPVAVGLNVTLMVQLPRAATEVPQVLVWA